MNLEPSRSTVGQGRVKKVAAAVNATSKKNIAAVKEENENPNEEVKRIFHRNETKKNQKKTFFFPLDVLVFFFHQDFLVEPEPVRFFSQENLFQLSVAFLLVLLFSRFFNEFFIEFCFVFVFSR